jgi:thiamine-monophosphate kinase
LPSVSDEAKGIMSERELILKIGPSAAAENRGSRRVLLGIGDDAALWSPKHKRPIILTCDWFLPGTHFLPDHHPADAVGWKCLARAVSDIAAMGGQPQCFVLSLAIPMSLTGKWLSGFLRGLRRAARTLGCELVGGDTTQRDEVLISVTVIGELSARKAVLRSGARPGDAVYVSGRLGEAEWGLRMLRRKSGIAKAARAAMRKHLYPRPRVELGQWLAGKGFASAMMDLSDGLSTDLGRLCAASGVGVIIEDNSLPVTSFVARREARELALHGGDDYELMFTVPRNKEKSLPPRFQGLPLTRIGEITQGRKVLHTYGGKTVRLHSGGWDPFREK